MKKLLAALLLFVNSALASDQVILYPAGLPFYGMDTASSTNWAVHTQTKIQGDSSAAGIALPFIGDGTAIKTVDVRIHSGSQAGTLHLEIQTPSATPDVNNVSGLPSGTVITNGTSGTASITGAVNEIVTLTFTTAPTPTGFHYLVFTGSSGGTIDIEISYTQDYWYQNFHFGRDIAPRSYDGTDWNNLISVGQPAVAAFDASGNAVASIAKRYPPALNTNTEMTDALNADNKEVVGVKFTCPDNLTKLKGAVWNVSRHDADMNYQMKIAKDDGTVLASSSVFNQQHVRASGRSISVYFDTIVTLTAGDTYRLFLMNPDDTADDIGIEYFNLSAASDQTKYFGLDSGEFALSTATDPPEYGASGTGTWTDENTHLPMMNMIFILDVADISGGGGATQHAHSF
jgi:hypothetical protein